MIDFRKYVIDTNCYIDGTRDPVFAESLVAFAARVAPGLHVSAVVLAELEAGMRSEERTFFQREIVHVFAGYRRIVTPSESCWRRLGEVIGDRGKSRGGTLSMKRSFAFDILLACSCREIGATLVTRNARDFSRIAEFVDVDVVAPFAT